MGLKANLASKTNNTKNVISVQICRPQSMLSSPPPAASSACATVVTPINATQNRQSLMNAFIVRSLDDEQQDDGDNQGVQHLRFRERETDKHKLLDDWFGFGLARR